MHVRFRKRYKVPQQGDHLPFYDCRLRNRHACVFGGILPRFSALWSFHWLSADVYGGLPTSRAEWEVARPSPARKTTEQAPEFPRVGRGAVRGLLSAD